MGERELIGKGGKKWQLLLHNSEESNMDIVLTSIQEGGLHFHTDAMQVHEKLQF